LVRATTYPKRKDGSGSRKNISNATISLLRYATAKEAGTIAVPHWLPRGSMVKIQTQQGVYAYIASDNGGDVDNRKAAQSSGKTIDHLRRPHSAFDRSEPVLPFGKPDAPLRVRRSSQFWG
jgi:hypothetical protein